MFTSDVKSGIAILKMLGADKRLGTGREYVKKHASWEARGLSSDLLLGSNPWGSGSLSHPGDTRSVVAKACRKSNSYWQNGSARCRADYTDAGVDVCTVALFVMHSPLIVLCNPVNSLPVRQRTKLMYGTALFRRTLASSYQRPFPNEEFSAVSWTTVRGLR